MFGAGIGYLEAFLKTVVKLNLFIPIVILVWWSLPEPTGNNLLKLKEEVVKLRRILVLLLMEMEIALALSIVTVPLSVLTRF